MSVTDKPPKPTVTDKPPKPTVTDKPPKPTVTDKPPKPPKGSRSQDVQNSGLPQKSKTTRFFMSLASALIVAAGLIIGLFISFMMTFCLKDCDPTFIEASSIIWAPLGSLLITVPISRSIEKRK